MAIQFARVEIVGRSSWGNACCKGAYNARTKVKDEKTNVTYNFSNKGDNVHHAVLLPEHVNKKFLSVAELMNEVERCEKQKNSQLLKDIVLALPDDKELSLQDRINITYLLIEKRGWVKEGLGVQVDIHKPHDGEKNWHAHLLITTRRFTECGQFLSPKKARDLNPEFKTGRSGNFIVPEAQQIHEDLRDIINDYFKEMGLDKRVDSIGINPQEHIGPVRMRSVMNAASMRNEERRIAEIEHLNNGQALLDKVTRHMSVFTKSDLMRAVKSVPNEETRQKLVEEALADKSVISLFKEDGTYTHYYTTREVRLEESKILRLSGYVANGDNILMNGSKSLIKHTQGLMESARSDLTEEQYTALSELITSGSGLRILRGRAGVGKSRVLHKVRLIAESNNINVIGLAPTHKAKEVLASNGFESTDTIKGMLFKLANGRFSLPKGSLLVVDEAGMVGNDDYRELLRVAATRKCNVILSGDERQLTSVQRGGMFEVFANKYGSSTILDIKRQEAEWGKSVAKAFSEGNVRTGVSILSQANCIDIQENREESMQALLARWHNSSADLSNKLILAVKNKDVSALNHGARQYLKLEGKLSGLEVEVGGNYYMKGDRILIGKTDKELGLINGEIGEILKASKDRFVVSMQNTGSSDARIIEFNPSEYGNFKHGYATTIFKAQGASIRDVYVFHDGFAGLRNSYVALSRHILELNLYVNNKSTPGIDALIKQLSYDPERGSSLHYFSEEEVKIHRENTETLANISLFDSILLSAYDVAARGITKLADKYLPSSEYYNYREPEQKRFSVTEVIDKVYEQNHNVASVVYENKQVVGGNLNTYTDHEVNRDNSDKAVPHSRTVLSAQERFYANTDYDGKKERSSFDLKTKWDREAELLRKEVCYKAESIATALLGQPNKRLSSGKELRFGDTGKIVVRISGEKAGTWYNFSEDKGGDMFSLVQDVRGGDFKGAANYLRNTFGIEDSLRLNRGHLKLVYDHENSNVTEKYIKQQEASRREAKAKQAMVNKLYDQSKSILVYSTAHRYLTKVRSITCALGGDIRTTGIYEKEAGKSFPALVAFARDEGGNITGGQRLLLDSKTYEKAKVDTPKKSFGRISGSFVEVSNPGCDLRNLSGQLLKSHEAITIIAEGLETALSIKQALSEHSEKKGIEQIRILCSLGISNIKNYRPREGEKIIIAADNDGPDATTHKVIENASLELSSKGAFVEIVRPERLGDFNDMLKDKSLGETAIRDSFKNALGRHQAVTLSEYLGNNKGAYRLSVQEQKNLAFIQKYDLPENTIVDGYRRSSTLGMLELEHSRKSLEFASACYKQNREILLEARDWGYLASEVVSTKSMLGLDEIRAHSFCTNLRDNHLEGYLKKNITEFVQQKNKVGSINTLKPIIFAEQEFLKEVYDSLRSPIKQRPNSIARKLEAAEIAAKQPELLGKIFLLADELIKEHGQSEKSVCSYLSSSLNTGDVYTELDKKVETHRINQAISKLDDQIDAATTIEGAIKALDDKQKFCMRIYQNLKYKEADTNDFKLLSQVAKIFQSEKISDQLRESVKASIELGIHSKEFLLNELKTTNNSKNTYIKLSKEVEAASINNTLGALDETIKESQNLQKTIKLLEAKSKFLAGLEGNLKYPEIHNETLIKSIEHAYKNHQNDTLNHLHQIIKLHINHVQTKPSDINKILQSSGDMGSAFKVLHKSYGSHVISMIHGALKTIGSGKTVNIDHKHFNCPVKFMDHVISTRTHEYFPHKEVQKIQDQLLLEHQKQLTLSKTMYGPSL